MDNAELLKRVRRIEIVTGKLVSETFAGEYQSVFKGLGMEFAEVREYVPGDEVRTIDWNVSARTGKTYVKRYSEERELTLMLACDVSASNNFGSRGMLKKDVVAEVSALFVFSALKNNDRVGLLLFSDEIELYIPPKKGRRHILRIIRELLAFKPKNKKTNIAGALNMLNRVIKRTGILVLVSDFLADNYQNALKLSAQKFDLIPVIVSDPLETDIPKISGFLNVRDPESGASALLDLSEKHSPAPAHAAAPQELFKNMGLDFIAARTDSSLPETLTRFFKQREKRLRV